MTLFDPNTFYATERDQAEYAFHLSAKSWKDADGLRDDVARLERDRTNLRAEVRALQKRLQTSDNPGPLRRLLRRARLQ